MSFDQFNVSLLNKRIKHSLKIITQNFTDPKLLNFNVYSIMLGLEKNTHLATVNVQSSVYNSKRNPLKLIRNADASVLFFIWQNQHWFGFFSLLAVCYTCSPIAKNVN